MGRDKKRGGRPATDDAPPTQDLDGPVTAAPTEKPDVPDDELSVSPEDLGKHTLVNATEAGEQQIRPDGDASIEVMVPPNQEEIEVEEDAD